MCDHLDFSSCLCSCVPFAETFIEHLDFSSAVSLSRVNKQCRDVLVKNQQLAEKISAITEVEFVQIVKSGHWDYDPFDRFIQFRHSNNEWFKKHVVSPLVIQRKLPALYRGVEGKVPLPLPLVKRILRYDSSTYLSLPEKTRKNLFLAKVAMTSDCILNQGKLSYQLLMSMQETIRPAVVKFTKMLGENYPFFDEDIQNVWKEGGFCALEYCFEEFLSDENKDVILDMIHEDCSSEEFRFSRPHGTLYRPPIVETILQERSDLCEDEEIALAAVQKEGRFLELFSPTIQNNLAFIRTAVKTDPYADVLKYTSPCIRRDPEVLQTVFKNTDYLRMCKEENPLFYDKGVLDLRYSLTNGEINIRWSKEGSGALDSKYIVLDCLSVIDKLEKEHTGDLVYRDFFSRVSPRLRQDFDVCLIAVQKNGGNLKYVDPILRGNLDIVRAAVKQEGLAIQFADIVCKDDEETGYMAVKQDGRALQHLSQRLRNKKEIVFEAVRRDVSNINYASYELRADKAFVLDCIKINPRLLEYQGVSEDLRMDPDLIYASRRELKSPNFLPLGYVGIPLAYGYQA